MGCSDSRSDMSPEEVALFNVELSLDFHKINSKKAVEIIRNNSQDKKVSEQRFTAIKSQLGIGSSFSNPEIARFYEDFKTEGFYSERHLIALAILLGSGNINEKALAFYEACDSEKVGSVKRPEVVAVADAIFVLTAEKIPKLRKKDNPNQIKEESMEEFLEKCSLGINSSREEMLYGIFSGGAVVQKDSFVAWFGIENNSSWLDPRGIREKLKGNGKKAYLRLKEKRENERKKAMMTNPENILKVEEIKENKIDS